MGKSDPYVFSAYIKLLSHTKTIEKYEHACYLGFSKHNGFTSQIDSNLSDFYDLSLNNWDINKTPWNIQSKKYDLVCCTRCPYFSKDPEGFFNEINRILKPGGDFLVDWGLGDHWRFKKYKVGWKLDEEHEYAYGDENFLWSTIWHDSFLNHPELLKFQSWIKKFGYDNVIRAIRQEVPVIYNIENLTNIFDFQVDILTLWEQSPQTYFIVSGTKPMDVK